MTCVLCGDTYEIVNSKCTITELPNCAEIDSTDNTKCKECLDGYWMMRDTKECVDKCPKGYTK